MRRRLDVSFPRVSFQTHYNILVEALSLYYDVNVVPAEQAEVIFGGEGTDGRTYPKAITFFVPVELWWPRLGSFDYCFGFPHVRHPRYYRLPYYVFEVAPGDLIKPPDFVDRVLAEKRGFCSFVISNANPRRTFVRLNFFHLLNGLKKVDSGGRAENNIGGPIGDSPQERHKFVGQHRFHISFENKRWPGYVTEKLPIAMSAGTIPIYWGCPDIGNEFNQRSFINLSDFRTPAAACQRLLELENNRDELAKVLREPWFYENRLNKAYDIKALGDWIHWAVREGKQPRQTLFPGETLYKKYETIAGRVSTYLYRLRLKLNR